MLLNETMGIFLTPCTCFAGDDREENCLSTCAFSSDKQFLYAGTVLGDVKMFNLATGEENTYQVEGNKVDIKE